MILSQWGFSMRGNINGISPVGPSLPPSASSPQAAAAEADLAATLMLVLTLVRQIWDTLQGVQKDHLSVSEVAQYTARSPYTIRRWIAAGRIAAIRVTGTGPRGRLLVPRGEMTKIVARGQGSEVPAIALAKPNPPKSGPGRAQKWPVVATGRFHVPRRPRE